ncbi:MAG TPA: PIN domain-containing protein [Dehalococcoidia bacterium]|nr:PIN domain-containing protein [Dehalococcoidia bacterium]
MSGDFIDSNVLLYLFSEQEVEKRDIALALVGEALRGGTAAISFQVVQEVLNGITRLADPPASQQDARTFLAETLVPLWRVNPSAQLYERALEMRDRYRYSFYDSLIIAAALEAGSTRILSEDFQHGQRIEGLTFNNPFVASRRR